jgi:hypothetical protein
VVTAFTSLVALALSIYNFYQLRRDKIPRLKLFPYLQVLDTASGETVYLCWEIRNVGRVTVQLMKLYVPLKNGDDVDWWHEIALEAGSYERGHCMLKGDLIPKLRRAGYTGAAFLTLVAEDLGGKTFKRKFGIVIDEPLRWWDKWRLEISEWRLQRSYRPRRSWWRKVFGR